MIVYGETLTESITPAELADPADLEAKQINLFEEAKDLQNLNSKVKKAHVDADKEYEETIWIKNKYEENLAEAEALKATYATHAKHAQEHPEKLKETIIPWKLNFDGPSNCKPMATPKENMF